MSYEARDDSSSRVAQTMLHLFSSVPQQDLKPLEVGAADQRALWAADALHRANNLSQMSLSLGSSGLRRSLGIVAEDHSVQARALSRAYAELAIVDTSQREFPCASLLEIIAMRLVALFGSEQSIRLHVAADHVLLPAEKRRALTLIASELVVNALKYAFPAGTSGMISIMLSRQADTIVLSVADDGCGLSADSGGDGTGSALMQRLAALLGADMARFSTADGLRVKVSMPCGTC